MDGGSAVGRLWYNHVMQANFVLLTAFFLTFSNVYADQFSIGECMADVHFLDGNGQNFTTESDRPALFILWSMRCPCARKYSKSLNQLYSDFKSKGLQVVAVDPFEDETAREIQVFAKKWGLEFPVVKDLDGKFASKLRLSATPEAFLFDKQGQLSYHGAIDDARYFMKRPKAHYLKDATDAVMRNQKPAIAFQEPWGCTYYKRKDQAP